VYPNIFSVRKHQRVPCSWCYGFTVLVRPVIVAFLFEYIRGIGSVYRIAGNDSGPLCRDCGTQSREFCASYIMRSFFAKSSGLAVTD